ncbi:phasin family protein [Falsiroseomonas oryziterrae]|uniref:phasin family protein n=1 Tax=Falsiroseomonas oryziterrae TaxID=2911368 RepID=UPI001F208DB8|nr:phasin family protein [Roseomonas sp. NPKOSM-4]
MASEKGSKRAIALVAGTAAEASAAGVRMTAVVEDGAQRARVAMESGMEQMTKQAETFFKAAEDAAEFGRGNIEAFTKSAQLMAVGFQDIGKQVFAATQALTDHALESAKALAAVKSLKEAADIQAAFAKASLERSMSEAAKLQEATYKLAETAYAPLTARVNLAVEKFGKPLAA